MHISDGVLSLPELAGGFVLAGALLVPALRQVKDDEIPRIAVMTAAFFIASLIHIKVPPTSVHLTFHGLLGVVLGKRAPLAIVVGLVLQVALLGHGGFTVLGVNTVLFCIPALCAHVAYQNLLRLRPSLIVLWGGLCAAGAVMMSGVLMMGVLLLSQNDSLTGLAYYYLIVHIPIMILEGIVTAMTVRFLVRVDSDLLSRAEAPPAS